jgi:hypothetical protein
MTDFRTEPHTRTRVDISTGMPFAAFVTAFEAAAPAFDPGPMQRIVETGGTWDDVRAEVAKNAPNELMRYGRSTRQHCWVWQDTAPRRSSIWWATT